MNKLKLIISFVFLFTIAYVTPAIATNGLVITSISPEFSYSNTDFNFVMKIIGNGFVEGTVVDIDYPTPGFSEPVVKSVAVISATELRADIEIPFNTYAGFYNIKLTSPNNTVSYIKEGGFELRKKSGTNLFYPTISNIAPPTVPSGEKRNLTIIGEQFAGDHPLVRLIKVDGPEYFDIDSTRLNHQEINATTPDNLIVGTYDILVRGTGGYGSNQSIKSSALTVESLPEPLPVDEPSSLTDDKSSNEELPSSDTPVGSPILVPNNIPPAYLFDYRASFVDQSGVIGVGKDGILTHIVQGNKGSDIDMWIRFKNTSRTQWWFENPVDSDNIHEIRLGLTKDVESNFIHNSWISTNRLTKISSNILPGDIATLNFKIHIPDDMMVGNYKLSVGLVSEWITWIYDDVHWEIQVT